MVWNKTTREDLKVGAIVVWEERVGDFNRRDRWAKVIKVTDKGTVTIKFGDKEKQFRSYSDLRIPTEHEIALRKWRAARPENKVLDIHIGDVWGYGRRAEYAATVRLDLDSESVKNDLPFEDALTQAREDLDAFIRWYAEKPKAP